MVIVDAHKSVSVRIPAPVYALVYLVHLDDLFVCNLSEFNILEHIAAVSVRYAQVFMLIGFRVDLFQVLRVINELLA